MILTYSLNSSQIRHIVKKHWHVLSGDNHPSPAFSEPPLFVYKRAKSIRDSLIRAVGPTSPTPSTQSSSWLSTFPRPTGMHRCGHCIQCNSVITGQHFCHPLTGKKYAIRDFLTCSTANVIYLLKCPCGKTYVGKTNRALKVRISEHRSAIRRHDLNSSIARHFLALQHQVSQLRFMAIEQVRLPKRGGDLIKHTLQRELHWIYELNTKSPLGLNEEIDLSPYV